MGRDCGLVPIRRIRRGVGVVSVCMGGVHKGFTALNNAIISVAQQIFSAPLTASGVISLI